MSKKPNFENQNTKVKKYRQLKRYSQRKDTPETFLADSVVREDLRNEYLSDKD